MTMLYEECADLLEAGKDTELAGLIVELNALRTGRPSLRRDTMIRNALADHARAPAQHEPSRSTHSRGRRRRRLTRLAWACGSVVVATIIAVVLSMSTYLHAMSPAAVSAQTVLHRAAAAAPGPDEATHTTYQVSSSDGGTGTADAWIGYDGQSTASQFALTLTMSQAGRPDSQLSTRLVESGPGLTQAYQPGSGDTEPFAQGAPQLPPSESMGSAPAQAMTGILVGTLLAQKLSSQPAGYTLRQESLNGVTVFAVQPEAAGNVTYFFNAQSYALQGADWMEGTTSWQVRLDSSSTAPLSDVPAQTFSLQSANDPTHGKAWFIGTPNLQVMGVFQQR